jgi:short-subunit dehydrogenase
MQLSDRTILITGASTGIGAATARLAAARGVRCLVLLARDAERLRVLRADILTAHPDTDVVLLERDVRDATGLARDIGDVDATTPIDVAVINAGIGQYGDAVASPWEDIEPVLRTNIDGALHTARAVLPGMYRRGRGSVVFVSSVLGRRALPWNAAYSASKHAVQGFADALRLEARPRGVTVSVVCPARTATEFFARMTYSTPQSQRRAVPTSPPERAAAAVLRAVARRRREIVVSIGGMLYTFLGVHFPRLTDRLFSLSVPSPDDSQ